MDLYNKVLYVIGSEIGRVLKVDEPTARRKRGRFARVCVEVNLTKPLLPQYVADGVSFPIEYESMSPLCLKCVNYGHVKECCSKVNNNSVPITDVDMNAESSRMGEHAGCENGGQEGLWKVVQRVRRGGRSRFMGENIGAPSHFEALSREGIDEEMARERRVFTAPSREMGVENPRSEGVRVMKRGMGRKPLQAVSSSRLNSEANKENGNRKW